MCPNELCIFGAPASIQKQCVLAGEGVWKAEAIRREQIGIYAAMVRRGERPRVSHESHIDGISKQLSECKC